MARIAFSLPRLDIHTLPGPETIRRRELPNGITVLARENFNSPSVVISAFLLAGSLDETPEQAGLANLTAQALMRGTASQTFQEIFEAVESIGARLVFSAGTHTTRIFGKALVEDLPLLLEVLADVLRHPVFPADEFERLKGQHLTSLAIRDQDTGARAQLAFDELTYPNHPYRFPIGGFRETIRALEVDHLRSFHQRNFSPEGMVLAVVGAVSVEEAMDGIASVLGDWVGPTDRARPAFDTVNGSDSIERKDVYLDGKRQSDLVIGVVGPSRYHEKFLAAVLGNHILGRFGLFGRIGDVVRKNAGLAYYAYSTLTGGPGPGPWQVNAGVNPTNIDRAIGLIEEEIKKLATQPVEEEELCDNQANFIGGLPLRLESNEGVAGALLHIERYDLGLDYYQRYPEILAGISRQDILEVSKEFLDPGRLVIAVAGPNPEEV